MEDKSKPQNPYKERRDFFWDLDFVLSSCTIDPSPKRIGQTHSSPKICTKKEGTSFGTWICPQILHHGSRSQNKWRTNASPKIRMKKEGTSFGTWICPQILHHGSRSQKKWRTKCKPQNPYEERRDFFGDLDLWRREGGRERDWVWREWWRTWWRWRSFFFVFISPHARSRFCSSRRRLLLLLLSHRRRCSIALFFIHTATTISFRSSSIDHRPLLAPFLAAIQKKAPWRIEEDEHYRSGCCLRSRPRLHSFSSGGKSLQNRIRRHW